MRDDLTYMFQLFDSLQLPVESGSRLVDGVVRICVQLDDLDSEVVDRLAIDGLVDGTKLPSADETMGRPRGLSEQPPLAVWSLVLCHK